MRFENLKRFLIKWLDIWGCLVSFIEEPFCCGGCLALLMTIIMSIILVIALDIISFEEMMMPIMKILFIMGVLCFVFDSFMRLLVRWKHQLNMLDYYRRHRG